MSSIVHRSIYIYLSIFHQQNLSLYFQTSHFTAAAHLFFGFYHKIMPESAFIIIYGPVEQDVLIASFS